MKEPTHRRDEPTQLPPNRRTLTSIDEPTFSPREVDDILQAARCAAWREGHWMCRCSLDPFKPCTNPYEPHRVGA